ncbi:MAG: glutamate racemase [Pseudomonadota bacterium]
MMAETPETPAPILLFDTGVGGLTVHDALQKIAPGLPVIYAADYAGIPYGEKTEAEVAARVAGLLGRMAERWQPRLACIACNTASTIALGMVRDVLEIPIVGTVPAIKPAAAATRSGTIALVGTRATIRQRYVDDLEAAFASDKRLLRVAAPDLVDLAEAKLRGAPVDLAPLRAVADDLAAKAEGHPIDTLVLACTHFPLLREEFAAVFGAEVQLIDGAQGIARRIVHLIGEAAPAPTPPQSCNHFIVTGPAERAAGLETALAQRGFGPAQSFSAAP